MLKFICTLLIFIINIVFSFIPLFSPETLWVSRAESMAAGVFLGAAVLHLFPESIHCFGIYSSPIPIFITVISYLAMYLFEKSVETDIEIPHQYSDEEDDQECQQVSESLPKQILMFYIVLSIHSFVESFAFGFMKTNAAILAFFFAFIGHKPVECFVLGLQILHTRPPKSKYICLMSTFAAVSPLTIMVTSFFAHATSEIFNGVVTSISTGVFIYIGFHELQETLEKCRLNEYRQRLIHVLWFIFGLLWMCIMNLFAGEHEH
ncbi:ZIP Zinc transporter family protein [Trichomonas vaginalis G3]|uniref:ZIP Zinc transporter family protein n=1 Tax=Trichomonas vaginalis (strain ATCC PRA-98 / G3) TaxID=412133 RepID=A2E2K0_TRIV3|nr:zinc ion transmembrane transporter protein [Trichomonas vaginalis G3]EAY13175.1 ZIP Zinc transporter family protein [Trichomonas vaginalis G3]KAI5528286.1 zinc ion transmembrane transporter protein [Trichomonas vaginalis G3]|eukprot:XP_001325398.1 ZIP Zinc transporter family protein [Trichomonas vaginalis G3]